MAGPRIKSGGDPAIHVSARDSTDLAERDARIPGSSPGMSGHDEKNWRVGETARPTQNHANFRNRTLGAGARGPGLTTPPARRPGPWCGPRRAVRALLSRHAGRERARRRGRRVDGRPLVGSAPSPAPRNPTYPRESHLSQEILLVPGNPTCPGESRLSRRIPLIPGNPTCPRESRLSRRIPLVPRNPACPEESRLSRGIPLVPGNPTCPRESHLSRGIPLVPGNPTCPGESHLSRQHFVKPSHLPARRGGGRDPGARARAVSRSGSRGARLPA